MTLERCHHPLHNDDSGDPSPLRQHRGHQDELRQKAERVSQAAQDAIAKALQAGDAQQQLNSLRNTGGQ